MSEKERINLNICRQCENERMCFPLLKFLHQITAKSAGRVGRKRSTDISRRRLQMSRQIPQWM